MKWNALILAGSRGRSDPVAASAGVTYKALAPVACRPMIEHVIGALEAAPEIGDIAVSAAPDMPLPARLRRFDAGATPATSVLTTLDALGTPLLMTTADNPLLSLGTLAQFLTAAERGDCDAAAGVALREVVERAGNPARRTYLKFRDGPVSGCNLFAFVTPEGRRAAEFWRRMEAHRKRPWRMAMEIGPAALLGYLAGRLSRDGAAKAAGRAAGCRAALIALDDPFAAHDVDKPDDLGFADRVLRGRG